MRDTVVVGAILALTTILVGTLLAQGCRSTEQYSEGQEVHIEEIR